MKTPSRALLALLTTTLLLSGVALRSDTACACAIAGFVQEGVIYMPEPDAPVLLAFDTGYQHLVFRPSNIGSSADFGVVLPVPAHADVAEASIDTFKHLHQVDQQIEIAAPIPDLHKVAEDLDPFDIQRSGSVAGSAGFGDGMINAAPDVGGKPALRITSVEDVAEYTITQLEATSADALLAWLKENRYVIPPKEAESITDYVTRTGWSFVAVKVRPDAQSSGVFHPIDVGFPTAKPVLPTRILASDMERDELTLYTISSVALTVPGSYARTRTLSLQDAIRGPTLVDMAPAGKVLTISDIVFDPREIREEVTVFAVGIPSGRELDEYVGVEGVTKEQLQAMGLYGSGTSDRYTVLQPIATIPPATPTSTPRTLRNALIAGAVALFVLLLFLLRPMRARRPASLMPIRGLSARSYLQLRDAVFIGMLVTMVLTPHAVFYEPVDFVRWLAPVYGALLIAGLFLLRRTWPLLAVMGAQLPRWNWFIALVIVVTLTTTVFPFGALLLFPPLVWVMVALTRRNALQCPSTWFIKGYLWALPLIVVALPVDFSGVLGHSHLVVATLSILSAGILVYLPLILVLLGAWVLHRFAIRRMHTPDGVDPGTQKKLLWQRVWARAGLIAWVGLSIPILMLKHTVPVWVLIPYLF